MLFNIIFIVVTVALLSVSVVNFVRLVKYLKASGTEAAENKAPGIKKLTRHIILNYAAIALVLILWSVIKIVLKL